MMLYKEKKRLKINRMKKLRRITKLRKKKPKKKFKKKLKKKLKKKYK